MHYKNFIILLFTAMLFSCESNTNDENITIDPDNLLLGNWVNPEYENETTTFKRSSVLPDESYGITFKKTGEFIERTSGWCGTPPLSYFNVDGSFTLENDVINISTTSYPSFYGWKIVEITETNLVVKRELTEQEIEHRALMDLFSEISNLAYSEPCSNANNWAFTAFGAKACGGPQGYLPYSKNIDVASFLQKIKTYTEAEKAFNIKWGIISDCSIISPPKQVECRNGYPTLTY
ncbi:hypothetical protein [Polaribacter reichenbachii]|uniref:Lipocalin-like domain-containing protein n=1 Tax=Polaribacter reichenbachii TaxID=996801 RepID=A0A1B8TU66_9FLAO|nr:hypothetical protein [Polaribacter reichenbachii]OBY63203.1 hypothetical protein LPB301_10230 [Polaribacter reichenbachii]